MANRFQKIIYYLSAMAPVLFVFAIVWIVQEETFLVPLIIVTLGIVLIVIFSLSFTYGKKNVAPINVRITDVSTNDIWILGYAITYLIPLASIVIDDCNFGIMLIIVLSMLLVIPSINAAIPHPLLFVKKYHFYQVATENGVSSYVLISKKRIRNKKDIKVVGRIFEFLLIEK